MSASTEELLPIRLSEIDLVRTGKSAGSTTHGTANHPAFKECADQRTTHEADAGADAATAQAAIAYAVAAGA